MVNNFQNYSKYYDLLYKDKNYKAESSYVAETLRNAMPDVSSVLELGCGSGSHASYLSEEGFDITGIERSPEMVDIARKKNIQG
ncbi:MAG: class I SAM-dependent methyltransferase, partial [Flavobacterium sp.]